ncbi:hypothetical protein LOZ39_004438 [Ophidiomyces ophidiicola]|nr:hypothetical protein LOZ64_004544 [Ophidiomyces ophidiicola]KAI2008717.1 hypothetical protein LOZ50_001937 [Ophidiomyces ophidiicola]KAI2011437.1 hypothetical protein LOZ49_003100 [Ophidiomyces ophidiicola]KAI2016149.1 hypothetical protein LOZ46_005074 [Ophidiomyces ophidiicola]KAI2049760.1 hypothetical protein LOZ44_003684 [Ophidiomyces ophidiicola]
MADVIEDIEAALNAASSLSPPDLPDSSKKNKQPKNTDEKEKENSSACSPLNTCLMLVFAAGVVVLITFMIISNGNGDSPVRRPRLPIRHHGSLASVHLPPDVSCGHSHADAVARNCAFDVLAAAWIPPRCHDRDLARDAQAPDTPLARLGGAGPFPWWADANHTRPIAPHQLAVQPDMRAFTWETFHVAHCLYKWRALRNAAERVARGERDVWVHDQLLAAGHIDHCTQVIASQPQRAGARAEVRFAFGRCVRLDPVA